MIIYDSNRIRFIWRCHGSKIPIAFLYSIPSVGLAVGSHYLLRAYDEHFRFLSDFNQSVVWAVIAFVLSMMLGVRTNKAYDRFWEGISLVQQMRAEWFETASNLTAFSMIAVKRDEEMEDRVHQFQFTLVRLMSLMHGAALRQIGGNLEDFDVLDIQALDMDSLKYLRECELTGVNRVEVLLHWIQVLVTDSHEEGVIVVSSPILTRAYQTLSRGMVNLHNARKLAEVPFPFPMTQIIVVLLLVQSIVTPFFVATVVDHVIGAAFVTFLPIFGMWSVTFISGELEHPFGSDVNDLPLSLLQYDFNMTLLMLLDPEASRAPRLHKKKAQSVYNLRASAVNGFQDPNNMTCTVDHIHDSIGYASSESTAKNYTSLTSLSDGSRRGSIRGSIKSKITKSSNNDSHDSSAVTSSMPISYRKASVSHQVFLEERKKKLRMRDSVEYASESQPDTDSHQTSSMGLANVKFGGSTPEKNRRLRKSLSDYDSKESMWTPPLEPDPSSERKRRLRRGCSVEFANGCEPISEERSGSELNVRRAGKTPELQSLELERIIATDSAEERKHPNSQVLITPQLLTISSQLHTNSVNMSKSRGASPSELMHRIGGKPSSPSPQTWQLPLTTHVDV